jgi:hypothetical protein
LALIPLDAEAESELTPVEREATPLALVLTPVEADVDNDPTVF